MKKLVSIILLVVVLAVALVMPVAAGNENVNVCHVDEEGNVKLISVSKEAEDAHKKHGDPVIGEDVDENCQPINPNSCKSVNGVLIYARGTASCVSTATTGALPNTATATGNNAYAYAADGNNITATATGANARATAGYGNNNTATATGNNAYAYAYDGNNNTATATGVGAVAIARFGDNNTATAEGDGAEAIAGFGDNNTATAEGDGAYATAYGGDNNTVTATGNCTAVATGSSQNVTCP